jgi:hypothetical protein
MSTKIHYWLLPIAFLFVVSCQKQMSDKNALSVQSKSSSTAVLEPCGTPLVKMMIDQGGVQEMGNITVSNDEDEIQVKIEAKPGTVITRVAYAAGSESHVSDAFTLPNFFYSACDGPKSPDEVLTYTVASGTTSATLTFPASYFQEDGCVWLGILVSTTNADGTNPLCGTVAEYDQIFGSAQYQSGFKYCRQDCPPQEECGPLRTQTPGGWGAEPNGNNPGTYLHANFDAAFGDFITVGCYPDNYYVKLTSAQAITNLLPTGGKAQKLTANSTDPASLSNVLVGHVVALTLAVGFDAYDDDFGAGGVTLGDMKIKSGTFAGWTINAFLAEANKVLGGCSTAYTLQQILDVATAINENYVDGKIDNGYIVCPE